MIFVHRYHLILHFFSLDFSFFLQCASCYENEESAVAVDCAVDGHADGSSAGDHHDGHHRHADEESAVTADFQSVAVDGHAGCHADGHYRHADGHYRHADGHYRHADGHYRHADGHYRYADGHHADGHVDGYADGCAGGYYSYDEVLFAYSYKILNIPLDNK
ncbi:hypothetical protein RhiirA4_466993 [Rhizophagus irregularis]|uniref:Uncharacterized protein n=1 Tax=Rhizophagus irregularis TaxID=588596 RepID=A0A2I1GV25_9GLOM|nr:hypothetical protein RhiirA4_466993 [Rhizophagus irregularis]